MIPPSAALGAPECALAYIRDCNSAEVMLYALCCRQRSQPPVLILDLQFTSLVSVRCMPSIST
jgi:hypothetical protein